VVFGTAIRYLLLLMPFALWAQSPGAMDSGMSLGDRDFFRADYSRAIGYFMTAAERYRAQGDVESEIRAFARAAEACLRLSDLYRAGELLKKTEKIIVRTCQDRPSPAVAFGYELLAQWALAKGSPQSARPFAEKALAMREGFSGSGSVEDLLRSHLVLAHVDLALSQISVAQTSLQKAEGLMRTLGEEHPLQVELWQALGTCAYEAGDWERMRKCYENGLALSRQVYGERHDRTADGYAQASLYYKLALAADDIERWLLIKAFDIREKLFGDRPSLSLADSYERIAELNYNLSDLDGALDYYLKAQEIYAAVYQTEVHPNVALCYVLMARCYSRKGNTDSEFVTLQKALQIQTATLPPDSDFLANTYNDLSIYHGRQENPLLQLEYAQKAHAIWERTKGRESVHASIGLANMAAAYGGLPGLEHREKELLEAALAIKVKLMGEYGKGTARNYYQLGRFHQKNGDHALALDFFQRSLRANSRGFTDTATARNPDVGQAIVLGQYVETLRAKAQTLLAFSKKQAGSEPAALLAYRTYGQCLSAIDSMRLDIKSPGSKQDILLVFFPVFEEAIALAKHLYEVRHEVRFLHEAFEVAERSKAHLLLQAVRETDNKGLGLLPDSLLVRERELSSRKDYWAKKYTEAERQLAPEALAPIRDSLRKARREMEAFAQQLQNRFPQIYRMRYQWETVSARTVQKELCPAGTLLLEYFWGDSAVYVFALDEDGIRLFAVPGPNRLDEQLELLQETLSDYAALSQDPNQSWQQLCRGGWTVFRELVRPALLGRDYRRLVVVPDGRLNAIPFEALLTDSTHGQPMDFSALPYLVRDYRVSYTYSAALLQQHKARGAAWHRPRFAAFAPAYRVAGSGDSLARMPLPGAEREVGVIARQFGGRTFFGSEATEAQFKAQGHGYEILHLATHGYVSGSGQHSFLAFGSEKTDSLQDNALYAYELQGLDLRAELVVLSACETGRGAFQRGEGVLSMARDFMHAGSGSVVMSLWRVSDRSTAALMEHFYEGLGAGLSKDEALQESKLAWLRQAGPLEGHPFFWAGFVVVGNPDPLLDPWLPWRIAGWAVVGIGGAFGWFTWSQKRGV
jgi:CHAT domain-containing protein